MSAQNKGKKFDIEIDAGADFYLAFRIKDSGGTPRDLTGATVEAQLREYAEAKDHFDFVAAHNGEGGWIYLSMPWTETEKIGFTNGDYDVFTVQGDERKKWLYGKVKVIPSVTR